MLADVPRVERDPAIRQRRQVADASHDRQGLGWRGDAHSPHAHVHLHVHVHFPAGRVGGFSQWLGGFDAVNGDGESNVAVDRHHPPQFRRPDGWVGQQQVGAGLRHDLEFAGRRAGQAACVESELFGRYAR
jgi:hypothetical protein